MTTLHPCRRGHDNPVGRRYCEICGIGMVQASMIATSPPGGLRIRLDDGTEMAIDRPVVVGRDADISLGCAGISRHHARLEPAGPGVDGLLVTDLGSTNGTFIGGEGGWTEIQPGQLAEPGSVVALGPVLVTVLN